MPGRAPSTRKGFRAQLKALTAAGCEKVFSEQVSSVSQRPQLEAALASTAGMRLASRSSAYVLGLWGGTTLGTAVMTAFAFHFVSDLGLQATAVLKAYGAGALIAMTSETMIPEAFHNGPRYSGVLAAIGFAALILLGELAR
jgi:zinc transporter, ZIP family